jgi:cell division transport system permease protein
MRRLWRAGRAWLEAYTQLQLKMLEASLARMRRAPLGVGLTVLVIAFALALPASFQALLKNIRQVSDGLESTYKISLYLKTNLGNEAGRKLAGRLSRHERIAEATLITKEAGLAEFQAYSGLGGALRALDYNPLPVVVSIRPKDSLARLEEIEKLAAELQALPEADFVEMDMAWMRKLNALLDILQRLAQALNLALSAAVLFIVGNTIRLELHSRAEEIAVAKLMGATDSFVRRPFLYSGFFYGLFGGLLAWLMVTLLLLLLRGPAEELARLYGGGFELSFLAASEAFKLILSALALGVLGAFASATWKLYKLESGE